MCMHSAIVEHVRFDNNTVSLTVGQSTIITGCSIIVQPSIISDATVPASGAVMDRQYHN